MPEYKKIRLARFEKALTDLINSYDVDALCGVGDARLASIFMGFVHALLLVEPDIKNEDPIIIGEHKTLLDVRKFCVTCYMSVEPEKSLCPICDTSLVVKNYHSEV